jgi:hypothetical protein
VTVGVRGIPKTMSDREIWHLEGRRSLFREIEDMIRRGAPGGQS